ncbi:bifunctional [glutamine synthetase] adenylyltransferase/[glutamine synthetase]-adenylyl-L-tyrosine phosphorylase [Aestuariivirga sp.]|uniref:bifunctional [glutamine synthetase] adenylyltransferase/[glutamine synthetase]-adenylyl-L-tyrosine phosphorylase n=1 Tax=Aestuariivirga sp. TaxID=2650926 RepID=UPI0039E5AB21
MTRPLQDRIHGHWPLGRDTAAIQHFFDAIPPATAKRLARARALLDAIISASPFLCGLMRHDPEFVAECLESSPEDLLARLCVQTEKSAFLEDVAATGTVLRQVKAKIAVLVALADVGRAWSLMEVTGALTRFADAAVGAAVSALLLENHRSDRMQLKDVTDPQRDCGYVVLAMGKHGAHELNYSSDIDLIVLFDPETLPLAEGQDAATLAIRLTRKMVALLQDVDEHGYVFRTDLRLRPDPRATQVAIAIEAAAHYYENLGQNWERAAYIKARAVAGDIALGEEFLQRLRPYVWRKYLDFASIADVQSLIRQIHAVKGHGAIAVEGHNLKLGRGGIREIEFFVQTQQLIAGGRNPKLRGRGTLAMLDQLAELEWISKDTAADLKECYVLLRTLEHRAQMIDDQQTHHVPQKPEALENYAHFCGFGHSGAFAQRLRHALETVQRHSSRLFEQSDALAAESGSLVFTGGEDDPETIDTLTRMGFRQPSEVSAIIRGWHFGRYAATRTRRAREDLTELMPALLKALARDGDADRAFTEFDRFLSGLGAGVQLFAMLKANPGLLDLITRILGTAPRLAEGLSRRPRVLEAVLEPGFFGPLPGRAQIEAAADQLLTTDLPLEEAMDRARVLGREQQFRVGVRVLSDTVSAEEAGQSFANIADVLIGKLLAAALRDMEARHGHVEGGRVAVIAMGKLGGREMTAASDLDLILIYDHPDAVVSSSGARPLTSPHFYQRLTQRFISALTVPTAEGPLYEVDMRLRPSGSKGPVAASFASFKTYHAESAWTWEKLALTRARVVAGDASLVAELQQAICQFLSVARDEATLRKDVVEMRSLMLREHKPSSPWDIKRIRGGLVDLEFMAQFLQLLHAHAHPDILRSNTFAAFEALHGAGVLDGKDAGRLLDTARLYHRLTQVLRLCLDFEFEPDKALPGLNRAIAAAAQVPDVRITEDLLKEREAAVAVLFDLIVGKPVP